MRWSIVCLVAVALLDCLSDAQPQTWPQKPWKRPQDPVRVLPNVPSQNKQQFETPLDWKFPVDPVPEIKVYGPEEARTPVAANSVAVFCNEKMVHVEAKQDLLGIGELVLADDLTLGNCVHSGFDKVNTVIIFQAELQQCGGHLTMDDNSLIYSYILHYKPHGSAAAQIIRTNEFMINVECHYPRKHNVSSMALIPTWTPFSAAKYAEELLYFSLKLMTADWRFERGSNRYALGDLINIEASVMQYFHVPLRVFVDSCVATLEPNANARPNYVFIENHGCMMDAKVTGSRSQFMARSVDNKLHFQLEAFRFYGQGIKQPVRNPNPIQHPHKKIPQINPRHHGGHHGKPEDPTPLDNTGHISPPLHFDLIYLTCHLKATIVSFPGGVEYKACSYLNTWRAAGGDDGLCSCCDSSCGARRARDTSQQQKPASIWEGDVQLGPIVIADNPV